MWQNVVEEGGTDCQGRDKGLGDFPGGPVVKNPSTNVGVPLDHMIKFSITNRNPWYCAIKRA